MTDSLASAVEAVQAVPAVPTILEVVCRTTGMGFAAVARVTEDRWVACSVRDDIAFGLKPGGELEVGTTICNEIRQSRRAVVIDHVAQDSAFASHPIAAMYGFQSYISVPIVLPDGRFFGTLCAIDPKPARLDRPEVIGMFTLFAELIAFHLDAQDRLAETEARLRAEQHAAELREQFIAVLGHDLRNPLASIDAGARLLSRGRLDDGGRGIVQQIQAGIRRMSSLIDNILDFARGRMGGGFPLDKRFVPLEPALSQVVEEFRTSHAERRINAIFALDRPIFCDPARLAQMLSNLIANAIAHGAPNKPVEVLAAVVSGQLELAVRNHGNPIPPDARERLFQPFTRGEGSRQGLGLGLYIAAEIARAHGGTLETDSAGDLTTFLFRMSAGQPPQPEAA